MAILDYFQEPDAERFLLVEIQRNVIPSKTYYLADGYYITEPDDTPANTPYMSIIGGRGLPEFRRTLNDPFTGNASTSFGSLELSSNLCFYKQGASSGEEEMQTPKGAIVSCFLAAPVKLFPRTDAIPLAVGTVQRFSGSSDGSYSIEITDNREKVSSKLLEIGSYPFCYGLVRNMTPVLGDPATRTYYVNQGAIESIDAVYDDGVTLAPAQYTVNLSTGSFTLVNNPVGQVTADVKGMKVGGTWLSNTQQIISDILTKAGISGFSITYDLPSGTIGYLITQTISLDSILNDLCLGCGSYWLVDRLGNLNFKKYPVISGMGELFTESELLSELTYETEENLFDSVKYTYKNNWTVLQPRVGASTPIAMFVQKEAEEATLNLSSPDSELIYTDSPILKTYFDNQSDAQTVAQNVLNLFSVPRRYYSFVAPFINTLDLGNTVTVILNELEVTGIVTEVSDVFDGSYPTQKIKILV